MSSRNAPRYLGEAVAEQIHHRRHHALERSRAGQIFQPADGRLRAQIIAAFRQPPDRHLEGGVGFERVAVVAVGIACRDQQRAVPNHIRQLMHDPIGIAPIFDARRQPFADLEPLLDRRQQQYSVVRGQPATVKADMHRLARHRWQTRQNPRTFLHGGRELRWPRFDPAWQPNHARIQRFMSLPPAPSGDLANYWG